MKYLLLLLHLPPLLRSDGKERPVLVVSLQVQCAAQAQKQRKRASPPSSLPSPTSPKPAPFSFLVCLPTLFCSLNLSI